MHLKYKKCFTSGFFEELWCLHYQSFLPFLISEVFTYPLEIFCHFILLHIFSFSFAFLQLLLLTFCQNWLFFIFLTFFLRFLHYFCILGFSVLSHLFNNILNCFPFQPTLSFTFALTKIIKIKTRKFSISKWTNQYNLPYQLLIIVFKLRFCLNFMISQYRKNFPCIKNSFQKTVKTITHKQRFFSINIHIFYLKNIQTKYHWRVGAVNRILTMTNWR